MLLAAFTHVSFREDKIIDAALREELVHLNYEKLEFLGDVVLNLSIVQKYYMETLIVDFEMYREFFAPGDLHSLKAFISGNPYLSFMCYDKYFFSNASVSDLS